MNVSQLPTEVQQRIIKIQSSEGENFILDDDVAELCNTIKNLLRGSGNRVFRNALGGIFTIEDRRAILKKEGRVLASILKETEDEVIVLLHDVKSSTLGLVLDFCQFQVSQSRSEKEAKNWNADFVRVDQNVLCELASASYYLDIKPLVNLTSRAIATQVSGKSSEEIRETFHSVNCDLYSPHFLIRHRLQKKINRKKQEVLNTSTPPREDDRSVDDLLSFINSNQPSKKKKNKQKKNDEPLETTERKVESKSPPPTATSQDTTEESPPEPFEQQQKPAVKFSQNGQSKPRAQTPIDRQQSELFLTKAIEMDPHSNEFQEMFEEEEKSIDPEFKAMVDREVEEWQKKLDQIYGGNLQNEIF